MRRRFFSSRSTATRPMSSLRAFSLRSRLGPLAFVNGSATRRLEIRCTWRRWQPLLLSRVAPVSIPPTIQALLAARLDQLELGERHVLERGSIEGELFHSGAVAALGSDGTDMAARLVSLVRKDIVRPDQATFAGDDAFRFRHLFDP